MNRVTRWLSALPSGDLPPFSVLLPDGVRLDAGPRGESQFSLHLANDRGFQSLTSGSEYAAAIAYVRGDINITGDFLAALSLRSLLSTRAPVRSLVRHAIPLLIGQVRTDRRAIQTHYDHDEKFYNSFLDPTRTYSQGVFESDSDTLEEAMRRKLDFVIDSCGLRPGSRVLDVGGGWGAFTEYAGSRGIHVTSLTISDQSHRFITDLIARKNLPCQVVKQNFLEYAPEGRFQAVVILGVLEHMPYYHRVIAKCLTFLQPGGSVYIDGSAAKRKYEFNPFIHRFIYPGNHCMIAIDRFLAEVQKSPFELMTVLNDRHSYFLTMKHWARRLESSEELIVRTWGEELYRKFRLYMWGVCQNFSTNALQAYRILLRAPQEPGSQAVAAVPATISR